MNGRADEWTDDEGHVASAATKQQFRERASFNETIRDRVSRSSW